MKYRIHHSQTLQPQSAQQRGIVLPMALLLLVVISIIGVMVISNSTSSEKTMQGLRSSTLAQQSAEIALRYCEDLTMERIDTPATELYTTAQKNKVSDTVVTSQDDTTALWRTAANWADGAANRIDVPNSAFKKSVSGDLKVAPMCIVQRLGAESFLVTVRGFANDTQFDNTKKVKTGAEVWLQSVLTPES